MLRAAIQLSLQDSGQKPQQYAPPPPPQSTVRSPPSCGPSTTARPPNGSGWPHSPPTLPSGTSSQSAPLPNGQPLVSLSRLQVAQAADAGSSDASSPLSQRGQPVACLDDGSSSRQDPVLGSPAHSPTPSPACSPLSAAASPSSSQGALPVKACADALRRQSGGATAAALAEGAAGRMQPGRHVGLAHVELGNVAGGGAGAGVPPYVPPPHT